MMMAVMVSIVLVMVMVILNDRLAWSGRRCSRERTAKPQQRGRESAET
jgi:hypothetical protein